MNKKIKTLFQHWNERTISNFGSFQTLILNAYRVGDRQNMDKLEAAFPEWFVKESFALPTHLTH